jgi:CBS domain-containing protein
VLTDAPTVPPDTTLTRVFSQHLLGNREKAVAVVDGVRYLGVIRIEELQSVPAEQWPAEVAGGHMRTDFPVLKPDMTIREALAVMEGIDADLLPVVDDHGFVGVVTTTQILRLDEILGESSGEP